MTDIMQQPASLNGRRGLTATRDFGPHLEENKQRPQTPNTLRSGNAGTVPLWEQRPHATDWQSIADHDKKLDDTTNNAMRRSKTGQTHQLTTPATSSEAVDDYEDEGPSRSRPQVGILGSIQCA